MIALFSFNVRYWPRLCENSSHPNNHSELT